jgi:murein DD-endopeptidase MepM/ murein hydrolase activator NlpD
VRLALGAIALLLGACVTTHPAPPIELENQHVEPELVTVHHVVEPGQTLYRIAKAYDISVDDLMAANGITEPKDLKVGQELIVPGASQTRAVPPKDSPEPTPPDRAVSDDKPVRGPVAVGRKDGDLQWPIRGVLYGRFGKKGKEPHDGIDLAAPAGTPVKTAAPGTVLYAGEQHGYGLIVIVDHGKGLVTLYAHNRDLRVRAEQKVREGQVVATVGDSGATSGPHLHFEVRQDGKPVDPLDHLGPVPPAQ